MKALVFISLSLTAAAPARSISDPSITLAEVPDAINLFKQICWNNSNKFQEIPNSIVNSKMKFIKNDRRSNKYTGEWNSENAKIYFNIDPQVPWKVCTIEFKFGKLPERPIVLAAFQAGLGLAVGETVETPRGTVTQWLRPLRLGDQLEVGVRTRYPEVGSAEIDMSVVYTPKKYVKPRLGKR